MFLIVCTQDINAYQAEDGSVVVTTNPVIIPKRTPLQMSMLRASNNRDENGDNIVGSGRKRGDNIPDGNSESEDDNSQDNDDYSDESGDGIDDSDDSDDNESVLSLGNDEHSDNSSDSDDSSSYGDSIDLSAIIHRKKKRKGSKKGKSGDSEKVSMSVKKLKKALRKERNSVKVSKQCYKIAKSALKNNPRWLIIQPVLSANYRLFTSSFWKDFKSIPLERIAVLKDISKAELDLIYFQKFCDMAVAYNDMDVSTAGQQIINLMDNGYSFREAFKATKDYFITVRDKSDDNVRNIGVKTFKNAQNRPIKLCRQYNFGEQGCARDRCKFSHTCAFCGRYGHGLRNCKDPKMPTLVLGNPSMPRQQQ